MQSNQVGWYCGLKEPYQNKAQALAICKPVVKVGYKPQKQEAIFYRVDKNLWKSPSVLHQKFE